MEGIKKDIALANKTARMQKEIDALTPGDCETLCSNVESAQSSYDEATLNLEAATTANEEAQGTLLAATESLNEAQENYDAVVASLAECLEGCEPLPVGEDCITTCNEENNTEAAQTLLDEAQANFEEAESAATETQTAKDAAQATSEAAESALTEAQAAAEAAGCVCG